MPRDGKTVGSRQPQVRHHEVGLRPVDELDRVATAARAQADVPEWTEESLAIPEQIGFIIDHQDCPRHTVTKGSNPGARSQQGQVA